MDAVVSCVERVGLRGFTLEDVAAEGAASRATIYRHFPGGRQELVQATITREVSRFWADLAAAVSDAGGVENQLVMAVMVAHERITGDQLLQRLVASEAEEFLPALMESEPLVHMALREYLVSVLAGERLAPGLDVDDAGDYLARMLLNHIASPGTWDLDDEAAVRRLVRTQFLGGVLAPSD